MTESYDDGACVLVRVDLRPSTYRILARYAKERHVEVGEVISLLADRAVCRPQPKPRKAREHVEDDIDREIRRLNAEGRSDAEIAAAVGMSVVPIWRRRKNLKLLSPRERARAASS